MEFLATKAVAAFKCLQADCPDTCCKGWSMQVDDATFAIYKRTKLEEAVAYDGDVRVMRRDEQSGYCVKFDDGICGIHKEYGANVLGDACYFYPRVTRKFGDRVMITATLSCPEIARLMMDDNAAELVEFEGGRVPQVMRDIDDGILKFDEALKAHNAFLEACKAPDDASKIMARLYSASQSLNRIAKKDWPDAAGFMIKMADGKLPVAEVDAEDAKRVLQIFAAVIHATRKKPGVYLAEVLERIEGYLGVEIDWTTLELKPSSLRPPSRNLAHSSEAPHNVAGWIADQVRNDKSGMDEILKKYLTAQLSFSFFPFAGIGENIADKAKLLCYKFALNKLALSALPDERDAIKTIQSIARIIDHIADPTLIFNLMRQFGWEKDGRMVGLLGA